MAQRSDRKSRKSRKSRSGGSGLLEAAVPLSLLALSKFYQSRRTRVGVQKKGRTRRHSLRKSRQL